MVVDALRFGVDDHDGGSGKRGTCRNKQCYAVLKRVNYHDIPVVGIQLKTTQKDRGGL